MTSAHRSLHRASAHEPSKRQSSKSASGEASRRTFLHSCAGSRAGSRAGSCRRRLACISRCRARGVGVRVRPRRWRHGGVRAAWRSGRRRPRRHTRRWARADDVRQHLASGDCWGDNDRSGGTRLRLVCREGLGSRRIDDADHCVSAVARDAAVEEERESGGGRYVDGEHVCLVCGKHAVLVSAWLAVSDERESQGEKTYALLACRYGHEAREEASLGWLASSAEGPLHNTVVGREEVEVDDVAGDGARDRVWSEHLPALPDIDVERPCAGQAGGRQEGEGDTRPHCGLVCSGWTLQRDSIGFV